MSDCYEDKILVLWFEKHGDKLIGEEKLPISMEKICSILDLDIELYPLVGVSRPVPWEKVHLLQPYLKHQFDFEHYAYFVESYTTDPIEPRHVKYLDTDAWKVMKMVFKDLQEHKDIKCILEEDYVIGFMLDILKENKILSQNSVKSPSKSH
jgi:hypothetical protein